MNKGAVSQIDADMPRFESGFEKHQISRRQFLQGDWLAEACLMGCSAGNGYAQLLVEGEVDESGAINAILAQAA